MQKFNYHSHTYRCGHADMDMKDEDYIKEYIDIGIKKMRLQIIVLLKLTRDLI